MSEFFCTNRKFGHDLIYMNISAALDMALNSLTILYCKSLEPLKFQRFSLTMQTDAYIMKFVCALCERHAEYFRRGSGQRATSVKAAQ